MEEEVLEIAITVPYEIEIQSDDINLDNFECCFCIHDDSIVYQVPLKRKDDEYILKVPKELAHLGGKELKYKINVTQENAIFCASEGKMKILSAKEENFKVTIKSKAGNSEAKKTEKPKEEPKKESKPKTETKSEKKSEPVKEQKQQQDIEKIAEETIKEYQEEENKNKETGQTSTPSTRTNRLQEIMEEKARKKELLKNKDEINRKVMDALKDF